MRQEAISDVWDLLDRQGLRDLLADGPEPLFATVSGAHLCGFASANSDVDLRGAFVLPARELLRLQPPTETLTIERVENGVELDWVAHDVRKFAKMMTRDNGYVLEQLFSPLVVAGGDSYDELVAETERLEAAMNTAADGSALPADVDHGALNELLFALLMEFYRLKEDT